MVQPSKWYCDSDTDCTISDSSCSKMGLCECKDGKIFNSDRTKCIKIASAPDYVCVDNNQCTESVSGPSLCNNGNCVCVDGYRFFNDACVLAKPLRSDCSRDADCYDNVDLESMKCEKNVCECNNGYYERNRHRVKYDCRPTVKATGTCFFDLDCNSSDLICNFGYGPTGTCNKKNTTVKKIVQENILELKNIASINIEFDISCTNNNECSAIDNSFCSKYLKKCTCKRLYTFDGDLNKCVLALGSPCKANDECELKYSVCKNSKCQCKTYYINGYYNEKCYKPARGIGQSCVHNKNCLSLGPNAICSNKKCVCQENSKFNEDLMYCVPEEELNQQCQIDTDCSYKPYSKCQNFQCVCGENYVDKKDKCFANLGAECSSEDKNCVINNAECTSDRCVCKNKFLANGTNSCLPVLENPEAECVINGQCQEIMGAGAKCDSKKCICEEDYKLDNNTCNLKKFFGDICTSEKECKVILNSNHVKCRNNKCTCDYGYKQDALGCYTDNGANRFDMNLFYFITLITLKYYF